MRFIALFLLLASSAFASPYFNTKVNGTGSISSGGGGGSQTTPGGVTNSVQTNNGTTNSLGGDATFTYLSGLLTVPRISTTSVSVTGPVSASTYYGDGSHLTGISGGSSTVPASPVNSIQFNNAGAFGGSSNLTWNGSNVGLTGGLTASGIISANTLDSFFVSGTSVTGISGFYQVLTVNSMVASQTVTAASVSATGINVTGLIQATSGSATVSATRGYFANISGTNANIASLTVGSCTGCGGGGGGGTSISTTTFTAATNNAGTTAIGFNAFDGGDASSTIYGAYTGNSTSAGSLNALFGANVGQFMSGASGNSCFGWGACEFMTNAGSNVAIGVVAMQNTTSGAASVAIGQGALKNNLVGNFNTAVGTSAGANSTGSNNIFIGNSVNAFANGGSFQLDIGDAIWGNIGSGIGNANLIGINVTSPTAAFEVSGTVKLDILASSTGTNAVCWNSTTKILSFGICTASDENLKQNIRDMTYGLASVNAMQSHFFEFKDQAYGKGRQTGFIAQEMFKVVPEVVKVDSQGTWAVNYPLLVPVLVKALQEEDAKYQLLEARIEQLESKVNAQ